MQAARALALLQSDLLTILQPHLTSDGFVSFNEWRKYIEDAETAAAAQEQLYYQELQRGGGKKGGGGGGRRK